MHTQKTNERVYEAPSLRFIKAETEHQFVLSMTNGFVYDAEENDEYWYF